MYVRSLISGIGRSEYWEITFLTRSSIDIVSVWREHGKHLCLAIHVDH